MHAAIDATAALMQAKRHGVGDGMIRRFWGPALLLAALVIGDQIRVNRPDHKFRLILDVDTLAGVQSASGVYSVHPDRGYVQGNTTITKGDALTLDLGGKVLAVLLAHDNGGTLNLDDINFVAVRAFNAAGQRAAFKRMDRVIGAVPVSGALMPALAMVSDRVDPSTMTAVNPDDLAAVFGPGVSLRAMRVEIVPNGFWPVDFGGALGESVTRGILKTLSWATSPNAAATALKAAGWQLKPGDSATAVLTRD